MKYLQFLSSFFLFSTFVHAQSGGYEIKLKLNKATDKQYVLGHFFGLNQQIPKDTAKAEGDFWVFRGSNPLPEGHYIVSYAKGKKVIEVMIGPQQQFSMESDTLDVVANMKVIGSEENLKYYAFLKDLNNRFTEIRLAEIEYKFKQDMLTRAKLQRLSVDLEQYKRNFVVDNSKLFCAKIIGSTSENTIPQAFRETLRATKDSARQVYYYYRNRFWDNIDLNDERLVRSKILQNRLERYNNELTLQDPDSIIKAMDFVLSRSKNKEVRKYLIYWYASNYEQIKFLGSDAIFVHAANKYYHGEPDLWDPETVKKLKTHADVLTPLLLGKKFPEIFLTDSLQRNVDILKIPVKYSFLIFYDPNCSHCRESAPKLAEVFTKLKNRNCNFYMIDVEYNIEDMKRFAREYKLQGMYHLIDIHSNPQKKTIDHYNDFKGKFDISATPVIYVLDQDKKIIAKRLPIAQFEDFINFREKINRGK